MRISELTEEQRSHLAWRIDHHTGHGLLTASSVARGEYGDMDLREVFVKAGMTPRQAAIHAGKVERYGKTP